MAASSIENETPEASAAKAAASKAPGPRSSAPKSKPKSAKKASATRKAAKKPARKAAGGGSSSKSDEIRRVATFMHGRGEKPRPSLIVKELGQKGIKVSAAQVSVVLKKMGFRPLRARKAGKQRVATSKPASSPTSVSLEELLAARKAAATLGGTGKAIAALQALKKFED